MNNYTIDQEIQWKSIFETVQELSERQEENKKDAFEENGKRTSKLFLWENR